uniref:Uncharacterized protein n=1 Tax=Anguilla anguilla TaxID=7936 RepID=A0A0E9W3E8_ANGAN
MHNITYAKLHSFRPLYLITKTHVPNKSKHQCKVTGF